MDVIAREELPQLEVIAGRPVFHMLGAFFSELDLASTTFEVSSFSSLPTGLALVSTPFSFAFYCWCVLLA